MSSQPDPPVIEHPEIQTQSPPKALLPGSLPPVTQHSMARRIFSLLLLLALIGNGALVWLNQEYIRDWAALRSYQAPDDIAQLAADAHMTEYGRRLFFVNHPDVEGRDAFNLHCKDVQEEGAAVLGCFLGDRQGIYLYDINDARLDGIKQVTASHEMLHQAYMRLSLKERQHIDGLLVAFSKTLTEQRLKDKLALYQKSAPAELNNEMHSIFATEIVELPAELEEYYKQYFVDRQKVIAYFKQYRAAFDQRAAQIATYDKQLTDIRADIESRKKALDAREAEIKAKREQLDRYLDQQQIEEYNAAVPPYNALVGVYRQEVTTVNSLIGNYNQLIDARNAIAVEERELLKAQDSQAL
jgi:hypothetical protein